MEAVKGGFGRFQVSNLGGFLLSEVVLRNFVDYPLREIGFELVLPWHCLQADILLS